MNLRLLLYSLAIILLALAVDLRIVWQAPKTIIPKNKQIKISATVKKEPRIYNASQVLEIGDGQVYISLYPRYKVGDQIEVVGEFDSQGRMFDGQVRKIGHSQGLGSYSALLRNKIFQNMVSLLPSREATLVVGTVLGVDDIDRQFRDQLTKTGTIHVVVVSGQNLMIVAGVFLTLGKYLGKRLSLFLALVVSLLYALLTGFEPPVVRATLMVLASTLAVYFGRESLPIWNLLLAAFLIIFIWPQAIGEISFQLTFAATLGIMTLGKYISALLLGRFLASDQMSLRSTEGPWPSANRVVARSKASSPRTTSGARDTRGTLGTLLINNAAIAVSAYLFTAPIILYYFGRVSLVAPLANILVVEAVFPVMILGFLVAISSLFLMPLAQILAYFAYVPAFYFVKVVEIFAKLPMGQVNLGKGSLVVVVGFYLLLLVFMFVWTRRSRGSNF